MICNHGFFRTLLESVKLAKRLGTVILGTSFTVSNTLESLSRKILNEKSINKKFK